MLKLNPDIEELEGRLYKAEMLLNVAKTVSSFDTIDGILKTLIEVTSKELNADRSTIFLNDPETKELYSRVAQGDFQYEIRIPNNTGIAGHVFNTGKGIIVDDAYSDKNFNRSIDERTGYVTKNIICAPIKTGRGEVIGVTQVLNKKEGDFIESDLILLESITFQASIALQSNQYVEQMRKKSLQEMHFLDVVSDITSEIDLGTLLQKVMAEATRMLNAERSTLFLNDEKTNELFALIGQGLGAAQIRFPNNVGIAGVVFTSGETINIPHAYADLRFNPAFDKKTGFFTRSILCVPVVNKNGKKIGVTQVLNKRGGPFTKEDETRLRAFTGQVSIALENAKLFNDIQNMKNYSESMLESMTNGVITLSEDGKIITCNTAGLSIMNIRIDEILNRKAEDFFVDTNSWVLDKIKKVEETQHIEDMMDAELNFKGKRVSVNLTVVPLISLEKRKLGAMLMIEDISNAKRLKSTLSRYMDPSLADQIMQDDADILGGKSVIATILFSDIRSFTGLTEELGAQGTVGLLNEYFTIMVECIQKEGGMLDKFIGDAIMAAFGMPHPHEDDEDRAVRSAISMMTELSVWNICRQNEGKKTIDIGIGINTDWVVSGNIGSPKRMNYTVIGDGVNLASRLEGACKQYAVRILISENTYKKLRGTYRIREIDRVIVKGKTEPISIYEVLDYHTDETFPNMMESINHFKYGLLQYREKKWDNAIKSFEEVLKLNNKDILTSIYIERCSFYKNNPPDAKWDGVWIMTSK
ncbi:MAG: GAF domain-containing protein [Desulfobacterales bacterium]|nr:GAF domain-containing protein [Desulfobacterales bacterium]